MEENKLLDANENEVILTEDDFKFVQKDKKIKDKSFDTKPTTFFKDAMSRFAKSKSAVVAAIIIGILMLLSIIVPVATPYKYNGSFSYQRLLSPRLFDNGNWWAGKYYYKDINYNLNTRSYTDADGKESYKTEYMSNQTFSYGKTNALSKMAVGGVFVSVSSTKSTSKLSGIYNKNTFNINENDNLVLNLEMTDAEQIGEANNAILAEYKIVLYYGSGSTLTLKEASRDYSKQTINITDAMKNAGISNANNATVRILLTPNDESYVYLAINELSFSTTNESLKEKTDTFQIAKDKFAMNGTINADNSMTEEEVDSYIESVKDYGASAQANSTSNIVTLKSTKSVYDAELAKCSFYYDEYLNVFGNKTYTITQSEMKNYIANGWCEYTFGDTSSFKKLSDKCPINSVYSEKIVEGTYELSADVTMYRYYGYDSVPRFIMGTDQYGNPMFSYAFFALQTSLLMAIIIFIINFTIGIIYGSIEGYFGGNVDLFMERITDILSYIPGTILLTLLFLNLGRTIVVFTLAMCLTGWIGVASGTRTQFYRFKGREYVLASRTLGASDVRLIFKHVLPNAMGTLITSTVLMIPGIIRSEASLAYLGLGLKGTASFGVILSENQTLLSTRGYLVIFPDIILALLMITFNLFGNGLRDAFNPTLKGSD